MIKKKIILTFDYELYLGKNSGTIEKCIIEPTNKILTICDRANMKCLFFIDSTFLKVIKKDYFSGYLKIKTQILDILNRGHDIGLHLHPHWLDSYKLSANRWSFKNYNHFRIHNVSSDVKSKLIFDSFEELNSIAMEFSKEYKINSFRAGGWSLQPFSYLKYDLEKCGIKYDFSALPGMKLDNLPKHFYDYKKLKNKKTHWRFKDDPINEDITGSFIEVPCSIVKMNIFDAVRNKFAIRKNVFIGDGLGADDSSANFFGKLKKVRFFIRNTLSSDGMKLVQFKKNISKLDPDFFVFVAHPKLFCDDSYKILEYLCENYTSLNHNILENNNDLKNK